MHLLLRLRTLFVVSEGILRRTWGFQVVVALLVRELLHIGVLAKTRCSNTSGCEAFSLRALLALRSDASVVVGVHTTSFLAIIADSGEA